VIDELLDLQRRQREAHLNGDAVQLVSLFADDFTSIRDGEVTKPSRDMSLERFTRYFELVSFRAWDDLADPVIEISVDATLATVLVQKRVHITYPNAHGERVEELTDFAWVELWRRREERWELAMVISTKRTYP
jgi:hypothetical protein